VDGFDRNPPSDATPGDATEQPVGPAPWPAHDEPIADPPATPGDPKPEPFEPWSSAAPEEFDPWLDSPSPPPAATPLAVATTTRRRTGWLVFAGAFAAAFFGALAAVGVLAVAGLLTSTEEPVVAAPSPPTTVIERVTTEIITQEVPADTAEAVARKVIPSIVTVEVGELVNGACSPFASGSGVILDAAGRIATNHHVVDGSECSTVQFQDGRIYEAVLLGSDPLTDLAVLDIDADGLIAIEIGSTTELAIGQVTIAVGNPLGQSGGSSLTVGVLSAINREVSFGDGSTLFGMLQTDAPITQGSSGGALVDSNGKLIGITSAIGVSASGAEGIGYAIPMELVERITGEIIESGTVRHAFLGIEGDTLLLERTDGALAPGGAEVRTVLDETTAATLGLVAGDVIVGVDDRPIITMDDLVIGLRLYRAGDEVTFRILRDGEVQVFTVALGQRPDDLDG